ncbi:hypothetical protein MBLNU459_g8467t1 [Dothideomycetes sp. NU459]
MASLLTLARSPPRSRLTVFCAADRELTFVPKKGRPVTQCQHCRSERKKRAAHVKCDCGDKAHTKEKCIHLRDAEAKATAAAGEHHSHSPDLVPLPEESSADEHSCCCPHGGNCNCSSLKKEPSDESLDPLPKPQRSKPRLTSHASEGHLTVFANGHHKPCHRNNNAAHESGAPYKLPRAHSHAANGTSSAARRSVDSLASVQSSQQNTWPHQVPVPHACGTQEHSVSQSEQGSPRSVSQANYPMSVDAKPSTPVSQPSYTQPEVPASLPSTTFQDFGFPSTQSTTSVATSATEASSMPAYSVPASAMEMGGAMSDYWSNVDWAKLIENGMDAQPALTNASSGTMSEVDDLPPVEDINAFDAPYVTTTQAQIPQLDMADNFTANADFRVDFGTGATQPSRWSVPVFAGQDSNSQDFKMQQDMSHKTSSTASPVADPANQSLPMDQFTDFHYQSASTSDPTSSAQSQSPMQMSSTDFMYQAKTDSVTSYSWDDFLPNYSSATIAGSVDDDGAFGMPVRTSAQSSDIAGPTANFQDGGDLEDTYGFDNASKMLQWNDGTFAPAGQDFLSTYNFDQDFSTPDFNNPWTS